MVRLTAEQGLSIVEVLERTGMYPGLVEQITDQIKAVNYDNDLIDTISRILGTRGRALNIINDAKLEQLRAAIFSPRELMRLKEMKDNIVCRDCSRPVMDETVVIYINGSVYCTACYIPPQVSCQNCNNPVNVYDPMQRLIRKATKECEHCRLQREAPDRGNPFVVVEPQPGVPLVDVPPPQNMRIPRQADFRNPVEFVNEPRPPGENQ